MITTIASIKVQRARKSRCCHDCLRNIDPGDSYTKHVLKDGSYGPYTWNTCRFCEDWISYMPDHWRGYNGDDVGPGWVFEAFDAYAYDSKTKTYGVDI